MWRAVVCLILSGCVQVFPTPGVSPQTVGLQPKVAVEKHLYPVNWQLGIEEPFADGVIDSTKIPLKIHPDDKISYLSYVNGKKWRTRLPKMFQDLIITAIERTKKVKGVARISQGLSFDRILIMDISNYEFDLFEHRKAVTANIRLTAKLMALPERKIIATRAFYETATAPTREFSLMLAALESATGKLLSDLTTWVLEQK